MRTLIDIPDHDLKQLSALSKERKVSRAHLVRCAIERYLIAERTDRLDEVFGIWKDRNIDGLEYQLAIRKEWDREWDPDH